MPTEEVRLGIVGGVNISILTCITLYRTVRFLSSCSFEELQTYTYRKKLVFHLFLLFASACDLPYYFGLAITGEFSIIPYSFHRFESALLFAAFSITISDWGAVLYDINEFKLSAFLLRRATLVSINAVYMTISLANFIVCYIPGSNMNEYLKSPLYITSIFFQIGVSFLLTAFMLSAGLKLSWRIQGAAGISNIEHGGAKGAYTRFTQRIRQVSVSSVLHKPVQEGSKEFRSALRNLNIVMGTCSCCILLQVVMLTLNYALGYASNSSGTVGPAYFYWTCYYWLPTWGIVLSLLYLSRAHTPRKTFKSEVPRTSIPSYSNNAMIGEEGDLLSDADHDSHYTHSGEGGLRQALLDSHYHEEEGEDHSSEASSSQHYLRGGFANNSYPPDRTGSRDDESVTSGITNDTAGDGTQSSSLMHLQMSQYPYSPEHSGQDRDSCATLTPMADLYHKGGHLLGRYGTDEDDGRTYSEDI